MRADRPQDRAFARGLGVVLVLAGFVSGTAAFDWRSGAWGAFLGGLLAAVVFQLAGRRSTRRRALLAAPFPERWRRYLEEHCDHYDRLSSDQRARFEDDLRLFLLEKRITGVTRGSHRRAPAPRRPPPRSPSPSAGPTTSGTSSPRCLLYPDDFDRDYRFGGDELSGQTHPWGTVILSVPSLLESFEDPDDAFHVGFHEFAHLLDADQTHFDGIPVGLDGARAQEWVAVAEKERERLRKGRSVLDPYGEEDPVEFLAVAVEAFFEVPLAMRKRHREMYEILRDYFGQDPAAADDARGLVI